MFNNELTTYKAGGALSDKSMHPSEYGRVSAWVKKIKNDLALVKDMYGHPPSIVFEKPAPKSLRVKTTDPPVGHGAPDTRHCYIVAADGTPALKRTINFSPPDTTDATEAVNTDTEAGSTQNPAPRPEFITIPNPDFIPTATALKLKTWV
jgi:hypothetical protein